MKLGVSGYRQGFSPDQLAWFEAWLDLYKDDLTELHHGDCTGVDEQVHRLVRDKCGATCRIHVYPPLVNDKKYVAGCQGDVMNEPVRGHMNRNRAIVRQCDYLLAFPQYPSPITKVSGTWMTVNLAKQAKRLVTVVKPKHARM